ncbi:MAG: sterol desaturase family protein [Rhodoblastus sp.]|uniref:sterol desaturase family protein n=1 Tax=Rhodoblastus sp. TaxID=1962975 RepID=UPI003F9C94F7
MTFFYILVFIGLLEAGIGKFSSLQDDFDEAATDFGSFAHHLLAPTFVYGLIFAIGFALAPESRGAFKDWPWFVWLPIFLIGEDMVQYWWHRLSHTKYGWRWHRTHHSAPYMGVRVTIRNNMFYTLFMPNVWVAAVFLFLGADGFAGAYALVKVLVVAAAHSELRWDRYLYRSKFLSPLAWIVERTISTPATHFAHHALSESDGIGHCNGNFGNLLFFWDVLFGTALITRKYPAAFGVGNDPVYGREPWLEQLFFPLIRSRRQASDRRPTFGGLWARPTRARKDRAQAA